MRKPIADQKHFALGLSAVLLLFLALCFVPRGLSLYASALLSLACGVGCFFWLKKRPFSSVHRRAVLFVTLTVAVLYTVLLLLSGLHFGFFLADTPFSLNSLFARILPLAVAIFAAEYVRGALLGQKGLLGYILAFLFGLLSQVLLAASFSTVTNFYWFMDLVGMAVFPALAAQPLYQYTGKHYGPWPAIVYRLICTLSPYLIPVKSGMPDSLASFISLLVPPALLFLLHLLYGQREKTVAKRRAGRWTYGVVAALFLLFSSFIMLVSNEFRYRLLVIATESMTGEIDKGDTVLYEEYRNQPIEEESVIVFLLGDAVTVHRVTRVIFVDNELRYYTKGDANDHPDPGYVTTDRVLGVVRGKLPYVGYPTLWLRGLFE